VPRFLFATAIQALLGVVCTIELDGWHTDLCIGVVWVVKCPHPSIVDVLPALFHLILELAESSRGKELWSNAHAGLIIACFPSSRGQELQLNDAGVGRYWVDVLSGGGSPSSRGGAVEGLCDCVLGGWLLEPPAWAGVG
jgi:hypothetical protein